MTDDTLNVSPPSDSAAPSDASSIVVPPESALATDMSSPSAAQSPVTAAPVTPKESQSAQESKMEPPAASAIAPDQHAGPSAQTFTSQPQTPATQNQTQSHRWSAAVRARASTTHTRKKQERFDKIIAYAHTKPHVTNDEIEKLLHVSDATASRYTKVLVEQGVLKKWARDAVRRTRWYNFTLTSAQPFACSLPVGCHYMWGGKL